MSPFVHGFVDEMNKLATLAGRKRAGQPTKGGGPQFAGTQRDPQKPEGKIPMPEGMSGLSWEGRTPDVAES